MRPYLWTYFDAYLTNYIGLVKCVLSRNVFPFDLVTTVNYLKLKLPFLFVGLFAL